jgi:hypothetical protein
MNMVLDENPDTTHNCRRSLYSLCIPRIDSSTTQEYILQALSKINMGQIIRIIELPIKRDPGNKRIIIKLKRNTEELMNVSDTKSPNYIFERLCAGENIKIVHQFPWYWKMVFTHPQKPNTAVL